MAIRDDQISPAVIVHIGEPDAPAEQLPRAQPGVAGDIGKKLAIVIVIERGEITRKVRFCNVQQAVPIIIRYSDAHAGLEVTIIVQGDSGLHPTLLKFAVVEIVKEQATRHVTGYIDVRPTVVIEISGRNAEGIASSRLQNARLFRYIGESTIAIVVIEDVVS